MRSGVSSVTCLATPCTKAADAQDRPAKRTALGRPKHGHTAKRDANRLARCTRESIAYDNRKCRVGECLAPWLNDGGHGFAGLPPVGWTRTFHSGKPIQPLGHTRRNRRAASSLRSHSLPVLMRCRGPCNRFSSFCNQRPRRREYRLQSRVERETGFEPATSTLARSRSAK